MTLTEERTATSAKAALVEVFTGEREISPFIMVEVTDIPGDMPLHQVHQYVVERAIVLVNADPMAKELFPAGADERHKMVISPQGDPRDACPQWKIGGKHKAGGYE